MAQEGIIVSVRILDDFSKPINDLQKSLQNLEIPQEFQDAVVSLAESFEGARDSSEFFRASLAAYEKLETAAFMTAAVLTIESLARHSNIAFVSVSNLSKVLKGIGVVSLGLIAIDFVNWLLSIGNAAQQAAQKIRDEFNAAIAEIDDNTAATQALVTQYIALREKDGPGMGSSLHLRSSTGDAGSCRSVRRDGRKLRSSSRSGKALYVVQSF